MRHIVTIGHDGAGLNIRWAEPGEEFDPNETLAALADAIGFLYGKVLMDGCESADLDELMAIVRSRVSGIADHYVAGDLHFVPRSK